VVCGDIQPQNIKKHQSDIEEARLLMDTTDMPIGFAHEGDIV